MKKGLLFVLLACMAGFAPAQDITLPAPAKTGGRSFLETVNARHSERSFVKRELPASLVSTLLWVANGYNRADKRTVPTAMNKQEMELYVILDDGAYFYDASKHVLKLIAKGKFKEALGQPQITLNAALTIVMVADLNKSSIDMARISTGYISQNIYLFAASEGLGSVARGSFDGAALSTVLQLGSHQAITLVQPVGYLE
ncbi:MAG: SagB/ThcOx family dehydrogenase [Prevotellaceae bacterium]|jgi:SagB-type dehydrogenase family enzyme|nr:SagB/ThcOx family dehydrogenase [Prevotellaceae bacterium]